MSVPSTPELPSSLLVLTTLRIIAISSTTGATGIRATPLRVLSQVFDKYLQLLAESAKSYSELSGRTSVSPYDVGQVIEDYVNDQEGLLEWLDLTLEQQQKKSASSSLAATGVNGHINNIEEEADGTNDDQGAALQERIEQLCSLLQEYLAPNPPERPICRRVYRQLSAQERKDYANAHKKALSMHDFLHEGDIESSSEEEEEEGEEGENENENKINQEDKQTNEQLLQEQNEKFEQTYLQESIITTKRERELKARWKSVEEIPSYVPSFLPPFPHLENEAYTRERESAGAGLKKKKQKRLRDATAAATTSTSTETATTGAASTSATLTNSLAAADNSAQPSAQTSNQATFSGSIKDPWKQVIPYESSRLATASTSRLPNPKGLSNKRRRAALAAYQEGSSLAAKKHAATSLPALYEVYAALSNDPTYDPTLSRSNLKRKQAALLISGEPGIGVPDTLYANIQIPSFISLSRSPGWLPYPAKASGNVPSHPGQLPPIPNLGPSDLLPNSATSPIPPSAQRLLVAPPGSSNAFAALIPRTLNNYPEVTDRLSRMAPPGPLDGQGLQRTYEIFPASPPTESDAPLPPLYYVPGWMHERRSHQASDLPPPHNPRKSKRARKSEDSVHPQQITPLNNNNNNLAIATDATMASSSTTIPSTTPYPAPPSLPLSTPSPHLAAQAIADNVNSSAPSLPPPPLQHQVPPPPAISIPPPAPTSADNEKVKFRLKIH